MKHFILNGGDGDGYQNCLHGYVEGASSSAKDRSAASVVTNIYLFVILAGTFAYLRSAWQSSRLKLTLKFVF